MAQKYVQIRKEKKEKRKYYGSGIIVKLKK